MFRVESRFQIFTPAEVQAVAWARLRERREGIRLCCPIAGGAVMALLAQAKRSQTWAPGASSAARWERTGHLPMG